MKNRAIRDNTRIENVDFTKLNEILNKKGIRRAELSRRCGYYSYYVKDHVFKEKKLNLTVVNILERVYGISLDEYCYEKTKKSTSNATTISTEDTQPKEVTDTEDDDKYIVGFSCNGEFLKKLAIKSMEENLTIQNFMFKCIIEGIGDKILEERENEK